jgi:hypothetical protein
VHQGREYNAFCEKWREVTLENQACYKVKVDFVHKSGIVETNIVHANGLGNAWLTSCWKQFISMPFVSILFQDFSFWFFSSSLSIV